MAHLTPFQTVGPYLSIGLRHGLAALPALPPESAIVIRGRLIDGAGRGIPDGLVEWWHPALPVVQRSLTTEDGSFAVETFKPPPIAGPGGRAQAPHLAVRVLGRGILTHYITRLYFSDDPATASDPILSLVPEHRRQTLIAQRETASQYRFDVILQGDNETNETVFFDL